LPERWRCRRDGGVSRKESRSAPHHGSEGGKARKGKRCTHVHSTLEALTLRKFLQRAGNHIFTPETSSRDPTQRERRAERRFFSNTLLLPFPARVTPGHGIALRVIWN
ncbi:hypothetical protein CEXT_57581, partial [Caerostris extrusa]